MEKIKIKSLMSLTIPIFLELLLVNVVGNIDTIMLGKYSDKAVGAVGGISQVLNIQNVIFGFISLATSILIAQYIGARNRKKIKEVISVSVLFNIALGIVMGLIYFIFWNSILIKMLLMQMTFIKMIIRIIMKRIIMKKRLQLTLRKN